MWILLAVCSALGLGFYDVFKKLSVKGNNVLLVLMLNTLFGTILMSPVIVGCVAAGHWGLGDTLAGHFRILLKAFIVLGSWLLGYFAIKHLPLTIQGPVNASRPVLVLVGALVVFGERLNALQWAGILLGFASLFLISRIGAAEGFSLRGSRWLWMAVGATMLGAVSALYDKYLLGMYRPLEVQAWYSLYQCAIMSAVILLMRRFAPHAAGAASKFSWRWSIPCISLFLTAADIAYFYSLSQPGAMISVVSMIRRGSVLVSFCYGVVVLRESHVRAKAADLLVLLLSLGLLVAGSGV
ncbi:MAG: DMT family transporter [Muribaculaceae bacterium]|jgi:transporter family protein|nr:DMT family transporter [Muribaculaceae bacterium]MCI9117227.1 DMT family transporter [Muribaculaceae bacterium]